VGLVPAARPMPGSRATAKAARGRRGVTSVAAATLATLAFAVPVTSAAPPPTGTPDPVAPGVPAHGRAWELVTPAEVVSGRIAVPAGLSFRILFGLSRSGDRAVYRAVGSMPGASYGAFSTANLAERGPDGWTNTPLSYPEPEATSLFGTFGGEGPVAFNRDLTASIWMNTLPSPSVGKGLFASAPGGGYTFLAGIGGGNFSAASEDLQRIVFESSDHLLPGDAARTSGSSVYEVEGGTLRQVDVEDDGSLISECGAYPEGVSADGQRVFFRAQPTCGDSAVYLRTGGHTTEISASQCTLPDCGPEYGVSFVGMTPDGSSAFLFTPEQLTNEDLNTYEDIYRYDVGSGKLSKLFGELPEALPFGLVSKVRPSNDG